MYENFFIKIKELKQVKNKKVGQNRSVMRIFDKYFFNFISLVFFSLKFSNRLSLIAIILNQEKIAFWELE